MTCIEWTGYRNPQGYGRFQKNGKKISAHRAAWEAAHGPIPDGLMVLHSCDNPPCVNIEHLRLGTQSDNMQDMHDRNRHDATKTHCKRGHEYNEENTYRWKHQRKCRQCRALHDAERRKRNAA